MIIKNTVIVDQVKYGISVQASTNVRIEENAVIGIKKLASVSLKDSTAGFDLFLADQSEVTLTDNIAAGIKGSGFMIQGYNCDNADNKDAWLLKVNGNSAGSCQLGFMLLAGSRTCYGMSGMTAYRCEAGVEHFFVNTQVQAMDFRVVDCTRGIGLFSNGP